ncbi:MAG TPA: hypothetical protein PLU10_09570 [Chitinophagaceae bacterium]|nr:hypothetical protein [Chitinophagaceae bacterium]
MRHPFFHFLLTYRIWIALAATGLVLETNVFLQCSHSLFFYGFIFSSTWFAYLFYYTQRITQFHEYILLLISTATSLLCGIFIIPEIQWTMLVFISSLSLIYLLPVANKLGLIKVKLKLSHTTKLFLLIAVWWSTTVLLPLGHLPSTSFEIQWSLYRGLMLCILCLLFYLRDEENVNLQRRGKVATYLLLGIQLITSFYYFVQTSQPFWLVELGLHVLLSFMTFFFITRNYSLFHYLYWIDGFMILHACATLAVYLQTHP